VCEFGKIGELFDTTSVYNQKILLLYVQLVVILPKLLIAQAAAVPSQRVSTGSATELRVVKPAPAVDALPWEWQLPAASADAYGHSLAVELPKSPTAAAYANARVRPDID